MKLPHHCCLLPPTRRTKKRRRHRRRHPPSLRHTVTGPSRPLSKLARLLWNLAKWHFKSNPMEHCICGASLPPLVYRLLLLPSSRFRSRSLVCDSDLLYPTKKKQTEQMVKQIEMKVKKETNRESLSERRSGSERLRRSAPAADDAMGAEEEATEVEDRSLWWSRCRLLPPELRLGDLERDRCRCRWRSLSRWSDRRSSSCLRRRSSASFWRCCSRSCLAFSRASCRQFATKIWIQFSLHESNNITRWLL